MTVMKSTDGFLPPCSLSVATGCWAGVVYSGNHTSGGQSGTD